MSFVIRQFNEELTLGNKLLSMRKAANITLHEMAELTKIRKIYLEAFEQDDYGRLPQPLYARNYLKTYVRTLGGDETYFLERFDNECGLCDFSENARLPRRRARAMQFFVASRVLKVATLVLFVSAVLGYFGYQLNTIITPPALIVFEPSDGAMTKDATITVTGKTEDDAKLKINGMDVLLKNDGSFASTIVLERGLNIIEIEGAKRYSRSKTEYRRVLLEQDKTLTRAE